MDNKDILGIVFDLDNTLIDRDAAFVEWLKNHLGEARSAELDHYMELDNHGYGCREELFSTLGDWNQFQLEFPKFFQPDEEVIEMLQRLADKGIELAILTNGGPLQHDKIAATGLDFVFPASHILVSKDIGVAKPEADAFHQVLQRLQLPADQTLMVGDHPENDCRGAKAVGMQTAWIEGKGWDASPNDYDFSFEHVLAVESLFSA